MMLGVYGEAEKSRRSCPWKARGTKENCSTGMEENLSPRTKGNCQQSSQSAMDT